jgi:LacI family transcriptional regulator
MMKRRVTIGDVAAAAGVSKQTVSRAINDKEEINPATKARILQIVHELGYRPNRLAQAMHSQRTRMVGLIVSDITNVFFPEVARGAQDAAMVHDYIILIVNTDESPQRELRMLELMAEQAVDGIISFTHRLSDEKLLHFAEGYRPIVIINREIEHPHISLLNVDNRLGAELVVNHFIEQGHQHIAMLSNITFAPEEVRRVQGYRETLTRAGLADYLHTTPATSAGGYAETTTLLQDHPEVSAIFCYNDMMAIGALRACRELGKRVPQDVAIVGFDDIQLAADTNPSLSSVHVDKYEIGKLAFQRVLDLINNSSAKLPAINIKPSLVVRASSRH